MYMFKVYNAMFYIIIHCEMITTIKLINPSVISQSLLFVCVVRTLKIDSFSSFRYIIRCVLSCFSRVWLFVTHQVLLSMGFSRQEYWNELLSPPLGNLPDPGIRPASPLSPASQADSLPLHYLWLTIVTMLYIRSPELTFILFYLILFIYRLIWSH